MLTAFAVTGIVFFAAAGGYGLYRLMTAADPIDRLSGWAAWDGAGKVIGLLLTAVAELNRE